MMSNITFAFMSVHNEPRLLKWKAGKRESEIDRERERYLVQIEGFLLNYYHNKYLKFEFGYSELNDIYMI